MTYPYPIHIPFDEIKSICEKWSIIELAFFGSVLRDDFSDTSDIDILVRFDEPVKLTFSDWDTMERELSDSFGRKVDLVDRKTVETSANYLRKHAILNDAQVIYAVR
ncbi:MAG: nucleotidyltransferase domain-containing protein [Phototrophicaceae bacterium]